MGVDLLEFAEGKIIRKEVSGKYLSNRQTQFGNIGVKTMRRKVSVPVERSVATLHLMVGLPCSGKTTLAQKAWT